MLTIEEAKVEKKTKRRRSNVIKGKKTKIFIQSDNNNP